MIAVDECVDIVQVFDQDQGVLEAQAAGLLHEAGVGLAGVMRMRGIGGGGRVDEQARADAIASAEAEIIGQFAGFFGIANDGDGHTPGTDADEELADEVAAKRDEQEAEQPDEEQGNTGIDGGCFQQKGGGKDDNKGGVDAIDQMAQFIDVVQTDARIEAGAVELDEEHDDEQAEDLVVGGDPGSDREPAELQGEEEGYIQAEEIGEHEHDRHPGAGVTIQKVEASAPAG